MYNKKKMILKYFIDVIAYFEFLTVVVNSYTK